MPKKGAVSPINGVPLPEGNTWEAGEEAREAGRKGGIRSGQVRRERKTLREDLLRLLNEEVTGKNGETRPAQDAVVTAILKQAMKGNTRAFEIIRDTIGEKPVETVNVITPDYTALNAAFDGLRTAEKVGEG